MAAGIQRRIPELHQFVRGIGRVVEIQDVTPPTPERTLDYILESEEARIEARVNGKTLKSFSTYHGLFGEGSAVRNAIQDAKQKAVDWPGVEIVVVKITSRRRTRPEWRHVNGYDTEYVPLERLAYGCRREMPEDIEEVVWSSKRE